MTPGLKAFSFPNSESTAPSLETPGSGCWGKRFQGDLIALKGGQQGQEAEDASDGLNLERLIQPEQDNIPGVPIVCDGPEGRRSTEWLGLSRAKLSGPAGVGGSGGVAPGLLEKPGQGSARQSGVGGRRWWGCRHWGCYPWD